MGVQFGDMINSSSSCQERKEINSPAEQWY